MDSHPNTIEKDIPPSLKLSYTPKGFDNETFEVVLGCKRILDPTVSSLTNAVNAIALDAPGDNLDISGLKPEDFTVKYEASPVKNWIKKIPLAKTTPFETYNRKECFKLVADITLDKDVHESGKRQGEKKRNTVIKFVPKITNEDYKEDAEWLYLFVINGQIVKIGGTRTGLKERAGSYLCGHHIPERGKSGDCSKTNGYIYNTFEFYLELGCKIEMYGYKLPKVEIPIKIFDNDIKIIAQTYHAYESSFIQDYNRHYKNYPILCDNCDPDYKN
jgi:hypothetical protein